MSEQLNPFEEAARYRKAVRLSRVMIAACKRGGLSTDDVAAAGPDAREIAARIAGCKKPPSSATWDIVVQLVRDALD